MMRKALAVLLFGIVMALMATPALAHSGGQSFAGEWQAENFAVHDRSAL